MNPPSKHGCSQYAALAIIVALCLGLALTLGYAVMIVMFTRALSAGSSRGSIEDRAEWPEPVRDLLAQASRAQIDVEPVRVYRIVDFTEKFYYWRMRSSPELIALMESEWQLKPGTQAELNAFLRGWPNGWEGGYQAGRPEVSGELSKTVG
jgi:hypothetical protein